MGFLREGSADWRTGAARHLVTDSGLPPWALAKAIGLAGLQEAPAGVVSFCGSGGETPGRTLPVAVEGMAAAPTPLGRAPRKRSSPADWCCPAALFPTTAASLHRAPLTELPSRLPQRRAPRETAPLANGRPWCTAPAISASA